VHCHEFGSKIVNMKRTCLQGDTNTDEQNTCEFHPAEILFRNDLFDTKEIQQVEDFVQMKVKEELFFQGCNIFTQIM